MVAKVISGKTIRGLMSYNENKVKEGSAACIYAHGFIAEAKQLSFTSKLHTFEYHIRENAKVRTNAVHISLNFDPKEKLNDQRLQIIASSYLEKIGFKGQPFLLYRHFDAAHPHVHIVTTNIQLDGRKISLNNIGRNQSEKARKEIEIEFGLVKAQGKKHEGELLKPVDLAKAVYGKSETKRAISNIVGTVTRSYRFASVAELNAVLKQYNVIADPGKEGTIIHSKKGLRFSLIDSKENPIGIPIKASIIYGKPTLSNLTEQFEVNKLLREPHKARVAGIIDQYFQSGPKTFDGLLKHLNDNKIFPVVRQNDDGMIYGLTFIDNATRCVFKGSEIGKQYSAKGILDRLDQMHIPSIPKVPSFPVKEGIEAEGVATEVTPSKEISWLKDLTESKLDHSNTPYELKRKKKRRGRSI
jgi:hypothetical protein